MRVWETKIKKNIKKKSVSAHFKCASQTSRERGEAEKGHGEREEGGRKGKGRDEGGGFSSVR